MTECTYKDIEFGKSSGEQEGLEYPELVENGFFDFNSILMHIKGKSNFLALGFKGSGKSLLAEKLRLDAEKESSSESVSIKHLQDFPFKNFAKILSGSAEPQSKYPTSWSWLILLMLIDVLRAPNNVTELDDVYKNSINGLEELGLLPTDNINNLVTVSSKISTKKALYNRFEEITELVKRHSSDDLNFISIVETLKKMVIGFPCTNKIYLVIDGLDDILTTREIQYQTLSALVFEANRLNSLFKRENRAIKVIVLCRTELFEKLPDPNKNKMRQDSSIDLDWYNDTQQPKNSNLVKLANKRASLSYNSEVDIFEKWFPKFINDKPTVEFILNNTRYTPRDFIQLLNYLKPHYVSGCFTKEQILRGLKDYSIQYFLPEIRDEVVGYSDSLHLDRLLYAIGEIKQREFTWSTLFGKLGDVSNDDIEKIKELLITLFNCSAIGNKWNPPSGNDKYEFRYRNRNSTFDIKKTIVLHYAMWKSLNLI